MPRIPSAPDVLAPTPRPARGVTDIPEDPTGGVLLNLGVRSAALADHIRDETDKVEEMVALQGYAAIRGTRVDLTNGDDGFLRKKGSEVLNRDLVGEYSARLQKQIEAARAKIKSPTVQARFDVRVAGELTGIRQDIFRHQASQREAITDVTEKAVLGAAHSMASLGTEVGVGAALADAQRAENLARERFGASGMTPDLLRAIGWDNSGSTVLKGIDAAVKNGNTTEAEGILVRYGDKMSDAQRLDAQSRLKGHKDTQLATAGVEEVYSKMFPVDPKAPRVSFEAGLSEIQRKFADNKEAGREAVQMLKERYAARNYDQADKKGALVSALNTEPTQATYNAVLRSDAFKALDPKEQGEVTTFGRQLMNQIAAQRVNQANAAYTAASHRYLLEERARKAKENSPAAIQTFMAYAGDPNLGKLSENQLFALAPQIGIEKATSLVTHRRQLLSTGAKWDFDKDILKGALAGIKKKEDQALASAKVTENMIAWKERNPGKVPTSDEQKAILRNSLDEVTYTWRYNLGYSSTDKVPAYLPEPEEAGYHRVSRGTLPMLVVPKEVPLHTGFPTGPKLAIPRTEVEAILAAGVRAGKELTADEVVQKYRQLLDKRAKKK